MNSFIFCVNMSDIEGAGTLATDSDLLKKYNPILVIMPRPTPGNDSLVRPGAKQTNTVKWGDYHPISVKDFADQSQLRTTPGKFEWKKIMGAWKQRKECPDADQMPAPIGASALEQVMQGIPSELTRDWELDVVHFPSQNETCAWERYRDLLKNEAPGTAPVVYGRVKPEGPRKYLQYWYLYLYNDFKNNHEGDWEIAVVELNGEDAPVRIGVSAHGGGLSSSWSSADVTDVTEEGGRPIIRVCKGSHAGHLKYKPLEPPEVKMRVERNIQGLTRIVGNLRSAPSILLNLPIVKNTFGFKDLAPAARGIDNSNSIPERHFGEMVTPTLTEISEGDGNGASRDWWLNYRGRWGSAHPRFGGAVGPDGPWARSGGAWSDPGEWFKATEEVERS